MKDQGQANSMWIVRVRELMRQGFGVEDVAMKLGCEAEHIRNEVAIYRAEGRIRDLIWTRRHKQ